VADPRAAEARAHHVAALEDRRSAAVHLERRDALVRELHAGGDWSYSAIATAVGCSREVVAKIVRPQTR